MNPFPIIPRPILIALLLAAPHRSPAATPEVVDFDLVARLSGEMRTNHPALRSLRSRGEAARHAADGARRWADPQIRAAGVAFLPGGQIPSQNGDIVLGFTQPLPVMGKEKAARAVAGEAAITAGIREETRYAELRRELAVRLVAAAAAERRLELAGQDLAWLRTMEADLAARHSGGGASAAMVLRLRNETARMEAVLAGESSRLDDARVAVNRALGRAAEPVFPGLRLPDPAPEIRLDERLRRLVLAAEPKLRLARREIAEAEARTEATRRSSRPDIGLGVDTRQYSGDGGLRESMFSLSVGLPWFNRANYRRDLRRDNAGLDAARQDRADVEAAVLEELHHVVTAIATARREALLVRDVVLPRTRAALAAAEASWGARSGDLRELLELRREVVAAESSLARAVAEQWAGIAELLQCCGLDDPAPLVADPSVTAAAAPTP